MKKYLIIGISIAVVLVLVALGTKSHPAGTLRIAANIPLSGPLAMYGEVFRDGTKLALKDLNKGNAIKIDWQDNKGDNKEAVNVMMGQLQNKPDIYISGLKPQTQALTDKITAESIPHFTWILDTIINPNSTNNYRTWVNFKLEANVFLNYAKTKKPKRVAITYVNIESAVAEYQSIVIPGLKEQGVNDFLVEPFLLSQTDMKTTALKIKQYNPDLLIVNGFIPQMVNLIEELHRLGFEFEGKTLASIDMLDASASLPKDEIEGIAVAAPNFIVNPSDSYKAWEEHFKNQYGHDPLYHSAYAYDMGLILGKIIDSKNGQTIPEIIKNIDMEGITGRLVFDEDQSLKTTMVPAVYRDGVLKELR